MVRRLLISSAGAFLLTALTIGSVAAGQPGAECGDPGAELMPHGFTTGGFANAETHYAGSDGTPSLAHANSAHAVSQYDIACVHFTVAQGGA